TIHDPDTVAVDRVSVRLGRVAPGDIVLMISPEDPRKSVVKRVVGMQGDSVTYLVDPGKSDSSSRTVVVPQDHVWGRSFAGFGRRRVSAQLMTQPSSLNAEEEPR
ncbi:hypothetical protein ACJX0J_041374, partial [Zea mays]